MHKGKTIIKAKFRNTLTKNKSSINQINSMLQAV